MNGITINMVNEFNKNLIEEESIIRLYPRGRVVDIKLIKDKYLVMEDQVINPTGEFYNNLMNFFEHKNGVKITFNNTWSCFWSTNLVNEIQ